MIRDLGIVKPGTTLYLPFHTFDSNDPSASVTLTGLAVTDVEVYKNGGTTQRASDAGYALLDTDGINFDGITGIHGISIDLADNTTAGFYEAGAQYWVVISSVTVDGATINFVLATFRIGYPDAILNTKIATLASQTSFTLSAGPAENDALNGCRVLVHDVASAVQIALGVVSDYAGSTKTVTLAADPGIFTMATGDNIAFFPPALTATTPGRTLDIQATGEVDANVTLIEGSDPTDQINAACDTALSDYDAPTKAELDSGLAALNDLSAAEVNAEVDAALSDVNLDHVIPTASTVNDASATVNSFVTNLTETETDHFLDNTILFVDGSLAGQSRRISSYNGTSKTVGVTPSFTLAPDDGDAFVILANSQNAKVQTFVTGLDLTAAMKASVNTEADTALSDYDAPTKAELDSGLAALNDLSAAEVNAEVDSALADYDAPTKAELDSGLAVIETDTQDIQSRLPAALVSGKMDSDMAAISGSTTAADRLEASALTIVSGAAASGTLSTTEMTTDLIEATNDHYNGRVIIWTSGVLQDQATDITDYDGTTKKLTFTAVTEAPSDGDTFIIL